MAVTQRHERSRVTGRSSRMGCGLSVQPEQAQIHTERAQKAKVPQTKVLSFRKSYQRRLSEQLAPDVIAYRKRVVGRPRRVSVPLVDKVPSVRTHPRLQEHWQRSGLCAHGRRLTYSGRFCSTTPCKECTNDLTSTASPAA